MKETAYDTFYICWGAHVLLSQTCPFCPDLWLKWWCFWFTVCVTSPHWSAWTPSRLRIYRTYMISSPTQQLSLSSLNPTLSASKSPHSPAWPGGLQSSWTLAFCSLHVPWCWTGTYPSQISIVPHSLWKIQASSQPSWQSCYIQR